MNLKRIASFVFLTAWTVLLFSCKQKPERLSKTLVLGDDWEFSQADDGDWMPAKVPGTVHSDLMANGVIEDPHYRMNEDDVKWIEHKDWVYRTNFSVDQPLLKGSDVVELQFKGLDTYADVYLNDSLILNADNMFVGYNVNVKDLLVAGENQLRVYFHSPVDSGMKKLNQLDYLLPATNEQAPEDEKTNVFTRKAPFHYGWDWGPRLVTSGIWRPVELRAWKQAEIKDAYLSTESLEDDLAFLEGHLTIEAFEAGQYQISMDVNGIGTLNQAVELEKGVNEVPVEFEIENPHLWWTNGLGEAHLYDFKFSLLSGKALLDEEQLDYGIRTLKLVQKPDETGHSFYFELNGVPVFMKGANVITPETLTPLATKARYDRLVDNAVAANMNMIRVWGGAIYGEDYLYDLCDRNGILIWQDFMFACALQPGDEAHLENIRNEAEYNVKRLRKHTSLALWCGNNENYHGWHEWGWDQMYEPDDKDFVWNTYETIFHEILPEVVQTFDSERSYWPSSPMAYGGKKADRKSGDEHDWTIWFGEKPFSAFGENVPRFVSEYGLQSFPSMHTIRKFSEEKDRAYDSEVMRHRQRGKMPYVRPGFDGNDMIRRYMKRYFKVPDDFDDFVYVSQLLQARAYKTAIEAHRRHMPHCMGSLYWQLNDSWPTISWSTVDYYGNWKASQYAVKKANEQVILAPVNEDGLFKVYAVSDHLSSIDGKLFVTVMDFSGKVITKHRLGAHIPANTSQIVFEKQVVKLIEGSHSNSVVVEMELKSKGDKVATNLFYFHRPKDLVLPPSKVSITAEKTEKGYGLTISADKLAKNVYLTTPDGKGFFTDNFFDVLPGKAKLILLETDEELNPEEDIQVTILNDL
ncbi:beta-mannosidase [Marinilabilia rubra]|uniref:Beta-mannosidase B n=1 Tax=Marinilabilia rubra TaxID=2162893 RepID=A0A2U2B796_9BACT|nr:glycoside hydrolase family 2 protein [Marinilabilia rubra]PWD98938.1 beta-mannosidase [Marinilabilia rubra]